MGFTTCEICCGELYGSGEVRRCSKCRNYCHSCFAKDTELATLRAEVERLKHLVMICQLPPEAVRQAKIEVLREVLAEIAATTEYKQGCQCMCDGCIMGRSVEKMLKQLEDE